MRLLTFTLGGVKYGIPIAIVQSIEYNISILNVQKSLPYIKGTIQLHGNTIPVYDLALKLGYSNVKFESIVVAKVNELRIAFEVEQVQDILEITGDHMMPMPEIVSYSQSCFSDVVKYKDQLIVLLDTEQLLTPKEQNDIKEIVDKDDR